ncbi:chitin synthase-domain-containing protein [Zychaea mexicana]|uniref:chitin synthase-domain-containing protein n=1 Tax=Zychaea mexicana TaxID=64656 RepID=UPI0022FF3F45|nr:chitin synthase-domain-containing protein [Zychaea mexicana]KAI9493414.1 chitin synthase-domain-containing protein [Zychaea mexicana]
MGKPKNKPQNIADLAQLSSPTEDSITATLRVRFENDTIYTRINDGILVALNPYKDTLQSHTSPEYVAEYKEIQTEALEPLPPHLYQIANQAYLHMRRTGVDQSIFLSGETGSGKTEAYKSIVQHLIALSCHKKETKLQNQVLNAQTVLEAFGHARTTFNGNASRFGKYTEIQFNERGRMSGAKTLNYLLEKKRVVKRPTGEGSFHMFYYLLEGASAEEKQILQLTDATQYTYLNRSHGPDTTLTPENETYYETIKMALRSLGIGKRQQARIMQLLACLLHLGNLQFVQGNSLQEAPLVKNPETLDLCADFLGVDPQALLNVLTYRTAMIKKDVTTMILDVEQAGGQRDSLVVALYSLLFSWLVEQINAKLCNETIHNVIGILDMPGPHTYYSTASFEQFCVNFVHERLHNYMLRQMFETDIGDYRQDGLDIPDVPYFNNAACVELIERPKHGLLDITNHHSKSSSRGTDGAMLDTFCKYNGGHDSFAIKTADTGARMFAIQHFAGQVTYNPDGFVENNKDSLSAGFVALLRGNDDQPASYNSFIVGLFADNSIQTETHPKQSDAILNAQQINKPGRSPSMRRSKSTRRNKTSESNNNDDENNTLEPIEEEKAALKLKSSGSSNDNKVSMALTQLRGSLDDLLTTLDETTPWFIFCLRPSDAGAPNMFDPQRVRAQVRALGLAQIAERMHASYTMSYFHDEFCERYGDTLLAAGVQQDREPRDQCEAAAAIFGWFATQAAIGNSRIFLSETAWRYLEDQLRLLEKDDQKRLKEEKRMMQDDATILEGSEYGDRRTLAAHNAAAAGLPVPHAMSNTMSVYSDDQRSYLSEDELYRDQHTEGLSQSGSDGFASSASGYMEMKHMMPTDAVVEEEEPAEDEKPSAARRRWVGFVWFMTWWIPSKFLEWCGKMRRKDIRMAWREKVALCMIIFLMAGFIIWFLVGFGRIVCPHQDVYSQSELQAHSAGGDAYVSIRGEVFDLTKFAPRHYATEVIPQSAILAYGGTDASQLFPVQVSALCRGYTPEEVSPYVSLDYTINLTDSNANYHDFRISSGDYRPDWYFQKMSMLRKGYKLGNMGYTPKDLENQANNPTDMNGFKTTRKWAILEGEIYDLTVYTLGGRTARAPEGQQAPGDVDLDFMDESVVNLFRTQSGTDITEQWQAMDMDPDIKYKQKVCLRNLFYAGTVDNRNSARCIFAEYLLLIVTVLLCAVIVFKFLAALQFGTRRDPEVHDKFVICQVPCYTEDEESLRKTIDSISTLDYDDKRKLMFLICDGMIVGGGNDRPTPRIVLDILGVDPHVDPEPLSFLSVGEGSKQHNMAKVYSGLYEIRGHVVPYIVVVKVGKPSERQKPGNRGKRDSQLILMRFLNKVHFMTPMTPMELEIYHQIKNVIGVNPSFYEFVLMVDADTEVSKDGLNRMVSCFVHDAKIIGLCGETLLSNAKDTWVTMIQVYEYFISHYLIKAFESLFGTVTCLPGCFCMYRVRSPSKNIPLLIANQLIEDYQVNKVDTLHKKNLLFLGEDRYLTTLVLKHFANYKTKFTPDAKCETNAPDQWSVLLSQRRRWINSTIHNLGELVYLPQLCGFCCFSMRFVVMLDLISTLVQPAIVGYLIYLIYTLATSTSTVPVMSIITIAGVYGLQAVIFILHRKWEHIMWMIVSIFAIPVFSFFIPVYSYWHFDDFSWGNTRVVMGEKGQKKKVMAEEGKFDPRTIPMMTWDQYEEGLFMHDDFNDNASVGSKGSARSGYSFYSTGSGYHYNNGQQPPPPQPHQSTAPGQYVASSNMSYIGPPASTTMSSHQSYIDPAASHQSFMAPQYMSGMPAGPGTHQSYMPPATNASHMSYMQPSGTGSTPSLVAPPSYAGTHQSFVGAPQQYYPASPLHKYGE